ncbi:MAG: hypothetical protein WAU24_03725 [Chitinophagaceae bacterium]
MKDALNPKNQKSVQLGSALPENEYLAYTKLQSLSRRSRYLVNEKGNNLNSINASLTYEIHLNRSLKHLHTLILFFKTRYNFTIPNIFIQCEGIKKGDLCYYK